MSMMADINRKVYSSPLLASYTIQLCLLYFQGCRSPWLRGSGHVKDVLGVQQWIKVPLECTPISIPTYSTPQMWALPHGSLLFQGLPEGRLATSQKMVSRSWEREVTRQHEKQSPRVSEKLWGVRARHPTTAARDGNNETRLWFI